MADCRCAKTHHNRFALAPFFNNRNSKRQQENHQHTGQVDQRCLAHIPKNVFCIVGSHRRGGQVIGNHAQRHIDKILVFDKRPQRIPHLLFFLHMTAGALGDIFPNQHHRQHAGNNRHSGKNSGYNRIGPLVFPQGRKNRRHHQTNDHNRDQGAVGLEHAQHRAVIGFCRNQVDNAMAGNAHHRAEYRAGQKIHRRTEKRLAERRKIRGTAKQQHHRGRQTEGTRQQPRAGLAQFCVGAVNDHTHNHIGYTIGDFGDHNN